MLDFTELSKDGQDLELLVREILFRRGFTVHWSGKGPDGGRDLICIERRNSFFAPDQKRWLIQCKHNAHSGTSVGIGDFDNIVDSCQHHRCRGYLLVSSTYPSSGVVQRFEAISSNPESPVEATYWDSVKLEQILSTPRNWTLAQRFFPVSSLSQDWQVYGTESPNHWVVNFKGYYFHLSNRIGSEKEYHLSSIKSRVAEIQSIKLPEDHFMRIRAVHFDDKNGNYVWYLDYMYPNDQRPVIGTAEIASALGDGYALEDGQIYHFDVIHRSYFKYSDHYDPDHYDYYQSYASHFYHGLERPRDYEQYEESENSKQEILRRTSEERNRGYNRLVEKFKSLTFLKIIHSTNARIEDLDRFHLQRNWSEIIEDLSLETDRFFSAWFLFNVKNKAEFHRLITFIPQRVERSFRLTRACIYIPSDDFKGSVRDDPPDDLLYELTLSIHPSSIGNKVAGRSLLNDWFLTVAESIDAYLRS